MAAGCMSGAGCVDSHMPVRATYVNLYKWAESDAEFVKSVTSGGAGDRIIGGHRKFGPTPTVVDSYSCRQMYLRSYTFSKKESVPERTRRCFGKVRERAADLPFIIVNHRRESSTCASVDSGSVKSMRGGRSKTSRTNKKKKKKSCVTVRKLKEASCSVFRSIFHRLLACTSTVDVVDHSSME